MSTMAEGVGWKATRFDRRWKQHVVEFVQPGPACSTVLRFLSAVLPGGLSSAPADTRAASTPTPAQRGGKFAGAASWSSTLWEAGGLGGSDGEGGWEAHMATGRFRLDEATLLKAYRTYFGCNRPASEASCNELRCPNCWLGAFTLDDKGI